MDNIKQKLYGDWVNSLGERTERAKTDPVTPADILTPEKRDEAELYSELCANPQTAVRARCALIRHDRAVREFNPQ